MPRSLGASDRPTYINSSYFYSVTPFYALGLGENSSHTPSNPPSEKKKKSSWDVNKII